VLLLLLLLPTVMDVLRLLVLWSCLQLQMDKPV
jgi:hypothetical protein